MLLVAANDKVWQAMGAAEQAELAELLKTALGHRGRRAAGRVLVESFWSILGSYVPA